ncbi:MAG: ribonuclease E/G [Rhodobacteraceae bacterium]|nr:ribonuclease E/G [Paracoccaceae bacterium]
MKKGRIVFLDQIEGRDCAALVQDGVLHDLIIAPLNDPRAQPEAIYRAKVMRPMKGQHGVTVDLGQGQTGFLKQAKGLSPGQMLLVQVATHAERSKSPPVTTKLLFKSRYAILTPDAPGLNIARKIRDDDERDRLMEVAHEALHGADKSLGLILRSACEGIDRDTLFDDISDMRQLAEGVLDDAGDKAELLLVAPVPATRAWRDWGEPEPDEVVQSEGSMELVGVRDLIDELYQPLAPLPAGASMIIEPTSALIAVDVNTGSDASLGAGLKANIATARDLPRQLRLRGLAGQIVIDFAPMPRKDRRALEQALSRSLRLDGIETILVGWTPLGHFELQRKRERIPLSEVLPQ